MADLYYRLNNNADSKGFYEVHSEKCYYYGKLTDYNNLGQHPNAKSAINLAKIFHTSKADGCYFCCSEEHKG